MKFDVLLLFNCANGDNIDFFIQFISSVCCRERRTQLDEHQRDRCFKIEYACFSKNKTFVCCIVLCYLILQRCILRFRIDYFIKIESENNIFQKKAIFQLKNVVFLQKGITQRSLLFLSPYFPIVVALQLSFLNQLF